MKRDARKKLRVAVVTGNRAEFGLLTPVMRAVESHPRLKLQVIAAGSHFLPPARTIREVEAAFPVAARVRMQHAAKTVHTRLDEAAATGRGVEGFARAFTRLKPDWVVVLGDRVEAFAAASAASIGGIAVAHIHGGDRAEGIADEAMRHAISKLAHLHLTATSLSAERVVKMGERREDVHVVGSPAIDGLSAIKPLTRRELEPWHDVCTILLHHPTGLKSAEEGRIIQTLIAVLDEAAPGDILALAPNHDPGHAIIRKYIELRVRTPNNRMKHVVLPDDSAEMRVLPRPSQTAADNIGERKWFFCEHLTREKFLSLLKSVEHTHYGLLAGNSSAGLIEAAALGLNVLNVGPRQNGRERAGWIADMPEPRLDEGSEAVDLLMRRAEARRSGFGERRPHHPYGDGRSGARIARLLASTDLHDPALFRKRNAY